MIKFNHAAEAAHAKYGGALAQGASTRPDPLPHRPMTPPVAPPAVDAALRAAGLTLPGAGA
jgi:hypothetical protein